MPLQQFCQGRATLELEGAAVNDVLQELVKRFPALGQRLFDARGKVNAFVNIYVNSEDMRLRKEAGSLKDNDEILIIYAISGG